MRVWPSLDMNVRMLGLLIVGLILVQPLFAQKNDCACETAALPDVLATVNGTKLKAVDVFNDATQKKVGELQQGVVDERKNMVRLLINSRLLDAEARKRGMSPTRLVKQEVTSKVADPTDGEITEFYNRNRSSISGDLAAARGEIRAYIRNQREITASESYSDKLRMAANVKVIVDTATPPVRPAERSRVFATINGVAIRSSDVEDVLRPTIFSVQEQVYRLRSDSIEVKVNEMLLAAEAQKRKITESAVINAEVAAKVTPVTDADARVFYSQNKERISGDFEKVRAQLIDYLDQKRKSEAEGAFAKRLRAGANIQVFLTAPVPPVYQIDTAGRPTKGDLKAPVTI